MRKNAYRGRAVKLAGVALLGAAILALVGCYYMPGLAGGGGGTASARIGLSRSLPANVGSIALIIGGPGMDTITNTYTAGTTTTGPLSIPAGVARTFTVLVSSPSATLIGAQTVDLAPGETRDVTLSPTVAGTQIVIPELSNQRITQISDMVGTGWVKKASADFYATGGATLAPYLVDFDSQGRIYVANDSANSVEPIGGLFRFDDIDHPSSLQVVDGTYATGIRLLAVDRTHGLVYYGTGSNIIYEQDVNKLGTPTQIDVSQDSVNSPLQSIAVDDSGILYIAVPTIDFGGYVVKYDPSKPQGSRVLASTANSTYAFSVNPYSTPWGILVKGPYVYVSDSGLGKVLRFDTNLSFIDSFSGPSGDAFTKPETFLATLNKKITVMDEIGTVDRIASFDDMTGAGWTTFDATSIGQTGFNFYSFC